jgi:hypothetical protein
MMDVRMTSALRPMIAAVAVLGAVACSAPASVDGVVRGDGFSLRCTSPLTKPTASGRDRVVVLAAHDSETLRSVNLHLKDVAGLPLNTPLTVGSAESPLPSVEAVVGDLVVETREDGVQLLSSDNNRSAASTSGTLTLTELDDAGVAGTFHVDLDDGGYLEGEFTAAPSL